MDLKLGGKTVFITGASGGIGRALCEVFAEEGANLVLHGHSQFAALEAWLSAQLFRDRALAVSGDVASDADLRACMDKALARFGRVDVAIANAGKWPREDRRIHEIDEPRLRTTLDANLFGAIHTARAFFRALEATGPRPDRHGASLTFIGSTAGRFGERMHADYSLSKAALYGLVRSLKNEIVTLDPYGRVNMVEPGWTVTHMAREALNQPGTVERIVRTMPLRQLARARDIARMVCVLSSHACSRHVSGEVITVAGGMEGRLLWSEDAIDVAEIKRRLGEE